MDLESHLVEDLPETQKKVQTHLDHPIHYQPAAETHLDQLDQAETHLSISWWRRRIWTWAFGPGGDPFGQGPDGDGVGGGGNDFFDDDRPQPWESDFQEQEILHGWIHGGIEGPGMDPFIDPAAGFGRLGPDPFEPGSLGPMGPQTWENYHVLQHPSINTTIVYALQHVHAGGTSIVIEHEGTKTPIQYTSKEFVGYMELVSLTGNKLTYTINGGEEQTKDLPPQIASWEPTVNFVKETATITVDNPNDFVIPTYVPMPDPGMGPMDMGMGPMGGMMGGMDMGMGGMGMDMVGPMGGGMGMDMGIMGIGPMGGMMGDMDPGMDPTAMAGDFDLTGVRLS